MFTIRKKLSADEGAPANTRQNPETGEIESTPDGGATWYPNPAADPRTNPANLLPAIPDDPCAAAAGMVTQMKIFAVNVFGGTTAIGIATLTLAGMVAAIPGIGWLFTTALFIAASVITAGGATLAAALTEEVWEDIQNIIVCHLDTDGRFTESSLDDAQAEITSTLGGTVGLATSLMVEAWGFVGFNNAGVLNNDPDAECEACAFCVLQDWLVDDYEWHIVTDAGFGDLAAYTPPFTSVIGHRVSEGDYGTFLVFERFLNISSAFDRIEIDYDLTPGTFTAGAYTGVQLIADGVTVVDEVVSGTGTLVWEPVTPFTGNLRFNCLLSYVNTGGSSDGSGNASAIRFYGAGDPGIDTLLGVPC